jgi:hypothetical protein
VGGSGVGRVVAGFKLRPSTMVGEQFKGQLRTRLGQTGAVQNVEHRHQVDATTLHL